MKRSGEGRTKLRLGRMNQVVGDDVGRGGVAGRKGGEAEKLYVTKKAGNDQQEEQGRGLGQEDCTKSGWEGMPRHFVTRGVDGRANQVQRRPVERDAGLQKRRLGTCCNTG
jgi:hypothetical protein